MLTQLAENRKSWSINATKDLEKIEKTHDSKEEKKRSLMCLKAITRPAVRKNGLLLVKYLEA